MNKYRIETDGNKYRICKKYFFFWHALRGYEIPNLSMCEYIPSAWWYEEAFTFKTHSMALKKVNELIEKDKEDELRRKKRKQNKKREWKIVEGDRTPDCLK